MDANLRELGNWCVLDTRAFDLARDLPADASLPEAPPTALCSGGLAGQEGLPQPPVSGVDSPILRRMNRI